jgi:hypothetical protein
MIINANALHIPLADRCVHTIVTRTARGDRMSKSYFHKRFDRLSILYANSQIILESTYKDLISCQNKILKLERKIEKIKRLHDEDFQKLEKIRENERLKFSNNVAIANKIIQDLITKTKAEECADSDTE